MMREAAEAYLKHLDTIFQVEPVYIDYSKNGEYPPLHMLAYYDIPEPGMLTGLTSGVSFVNNPYENEVRPELVISVDSDDVNWLMAVADIGFQHRISFRFAPGDTLNFNTQISSSSEMTSFFFWHQSTIDESHEVVHLPEWHIKLIGVFPIHDDERVLIHTHGPDWFFEFVNDPYNVGRPSVAHKFDG